MSRQQDSGLVVPSVFDRLTDDGGTPLHARSHAQLLRDLRRSVMRDVGHLLNTRRRALPLPEGVPELSPSCLDYGIPDITGANFTTGEALQEFRALVETVLRRYEPRFQSVRVRLLENRSEADRTLRFRIDALLRAEPAPEPVVFDSVMEPAIGNFVVKGGGGAA